MATTTPARQRTSNVVRGHQSSPMAQPIDANAVALYGDMRPLTWLKAAPVSWTTSSSMPRFQPNAISHRVAQPIRPTHAAKPRNQRLRAGDGCPLASQSAAEDRSRAMAVLAFISTAPGARLRRRGMSLNQPNRATAPISAVSPQETTTNDSRALPSTGAR